MKESEATNGTRLFALLLACEHRVSLTTVLNWMDQQASQEWDELVVELKRKMITMGAPVGPGTEAIRPDTPAPQKRCDLE